MVYISYNTGTHALLDVYALAFRCCAPSSVAHIYQAKNSCLCYNLYIYGDFIVCVDSYVLDKKS